MSVIPTADECVFVCACVGRGLEDLMTVNLARYRPTGEHVAIRRIDLDSCTNDMVNYLQVSRKFYTFLSNSKYEMAKYAK